MASDDHVRFRFADAADADAIAALHAGSWRRHYRGAYSDFFLDGDVQADRLAVWRERLGEPDANTCTIVAEVDEKIAGFVHIVVEHDPRWGALVDNLHVTYERHRRGIGRRLLQRGAAAVAARTPASGVYLWVLEQNLNAQAFYTGLGGRCVERAACTPPGGILERLAGTPARFRFVWDSAALLSELAATR